MARKNEFVLPRAVALTSGGGVRLQVVDLQYWESVSDPAGADGRATLISEPVDTGYYWRVERLVVTADGAAIPQCVVSAATPQPDPPALALRDSTRYATVQIAEYPTGLLILPNTSLIVSFLGLSTGARGTVSAQYSLVTRMEGAS